LEKGGRKSASANTSDLKARTKTREEKAISAARKGRPANLQKSLRNEDGERGKGYSFYKKKRDAEGKEMFASTPGKGCRKWG